MTYFVPSDSLTLRDHLAMAAMPALAGPMGISLVDDVAESDGDHNEPETRSRLIQMARDRAGDIATAAYLVADACLSVRKLPSGAGT